MSVKSATLVTASLLACMILFGCSGTSAVIELAPDISSAQQLSEEATWEWDPNTNCSACHIAESASMDVISCTAEDRSCLTCHTNIAGLSRAHKNIQKAKSSSKLKYTKVADATCKRCHDTETLSSTTAESTMLTDDNGTTVNPHDIQTSHNLQGQHDNLECASCHKLHSKTSITETSAAVCSSCHHAGVFECYTCHA